MVKRRTKKASLSSEDSSIPCIFHAYALLAIVCYVGLVFHDKIDKYKRDKKNYFIKEIETCIKNKSSLK